MSSVYVLEPPTKGKVVLNTSMGPIDIELWPKEAPKAVRNFVQLCLEGYYDRTIFHRIIKSFLVQSGDPTSTGTGGESIYGAPFSDEFHSRLRFNHRGLVACANAGPPHSNGSQFFITLDRCDWLDKKNTIFGKVTGDSIFNLLRIGDVETDKEDRPLDPQPTILSVEVLWNPFDDIIPRQMPNRHLSSKQEGEKNLDQKKKAVKKLNLLSFGEEAEEDEKELAAVKEKIQSLHDVIDDPRFLKEEPQDLSLIDIEKKKEAAITVRGALTKKGDKVKPVEENISDDDDDDDDGARFDARMRQQILRKRQERGEMGTNEKSTNAKNAKNRSPSPSRETAGNDVQQARIEKLSIKKKGIGSEAKANQMAKGDADLQLLGHAEQERRLLKLKKRRLQGREDDTLDRLNKFKQKISTKPSFVNFEAKDGEISSGKPAVENSEVRSGEDEDVTGWMANELKFAPESSSKDGMVRKDDPNEYVVVDPLLEKGKQKFNKMQAKMKRRKREWAGKSLT